MLASPKPPYVGLDLVEPQRLHERLARTPALRATLFTDKEVKYCNSQPEPILHLAARFCAKEAVIKALAIDGWDPLDVEIVGGGPEVTLQLHGAVADTAARLAVSVSISMTHLTILAGAVALAIPIGATDGSKAEGTSVRWSVEAVDALHRSKTRSYGGAWRKRGELLSILPNIFRKYDRLSYQLGTATSASDGEPLDETAVDLLIYLVKYLVLLEREEGCAVAPDATDDVAFLDRCGQVFAQLLPHDETSSFATVGSVCADLDRVVRIMETWAVSLPPIPDRVDAVRRAARAAASLLNLVGPAGPQP